VTALAIGCIVASLVLAGIAVAPLAFYALRDALADVEEW
jgi:hypothetical protein